VQAVRREQRTVFRDQRDLLLRCETLMSVLGMQILPIPEMPTRALALLTEDGSLALGVTAESAQELSDLLAKSGSGNAQGVMTRHPKRDCTT
jgi:hypothetical protein